MGLLAVSTYLAARRLGGGLSVGVKLKAVEPWVVEDSIDVVCGRVTLYEFVLNAFGHMDGALGVRRGAVDDGGESIKKGPSGGVRWVWRNDGSGIFMEKGRYGKIRWDMVGARERDEGDLSGDIFNDGGVLVVLGGVGFVCEIPGVEGCVVCVIVANVL